MNKLEYIKLDVILKKILFISFLSCNFLFGQSVIDECLSSVTPIMTSDFTSTANVANIRSADVVEWDGNNWFGGFVNANLTIAPLTNQIGCRAIFLGNGSTWTSSGEAIGLKLDTPLVSGILYNFDITYVSHGFGSNGAFSPLFYTNSIPTQSGATLVGSLIPVGFNWETNNFSFVANASQNGDEWIILRTDSNSTSGLISSFCQNCTISTPNCDISVNDETICSSEFATITATSNSTASFSYQWNVPTGATDPGNVNSFVTNIPGTYSVTATDAATNCTTNASGTIFVNSLPDVTIENQVICEDDSTAIVAITSTGGNFSFQWTVPSNVQNPGNVDSFTTNVAGNYTAFVTDTDTGCNVTATGTITISPKPVITVNSETICQGTSTIISATSSSVSNYEYLWTVPVGTQNPGNVESFTAVAEGTYSVIVNDLDTNCSSDIVSGSINYFPDFEFTIDQYCQQDDFILEIIPTDNSFSSTNASFLWELDNSSIIGNDSQINLSSYLNFTSIVEELPLNINVTVNSVNGCVKTKTITVDQVLCSIPEGISPNNDGINDSLDLSLLNVKNLQIFNRYGRMVYQKQGYLNEWYGQTNSGEILPTGTYFYTVELTDGSETLSSWIYLNK